MQRVALAHLHAYTTWATCSLPIGTIIGRHLVQVQLSLRALVANPMHHLLTAKGDVAWIHAILGVALKVPPQATEGVALHKHWLCVVVPPIFIASRTTRVVVLAYFSSLTTRAVTASRTVTYAYLPNMRASCWPVGA